MMAWRKTIRVVAPDRDGLLAAIAKWLLLRHAVVQRGTYRVTIERLERG